MQRLQEFKNLLAKAGANMNQITQIVRPAGKHRPDPDQSSPPQQKQGTPSDEVNVIMIFASGFPASELRRFQDFLAPASAY